MHPHVTVLGYCADSRVQLRLQGTAILHGPGSAVVDQAWSQLSARKRSTYGGGPPGDELVNEAPAPDSPAKHADRKAISGQ